ncbi:MAG: acyltransferase [Bacteroidales bacterium]|nr:acyltransferase [Bacteroidales bacterium]
MAKRTVTSIIKGIWIRSLSILAQFTFPAQVTVCVHRMRGVKIGKGSKINRTVQIDDSRPDLVEIGKKVWVTAGTMILCHQRDLSTHSKNKAVMDNELIYKKVVIKDGAHIGIGAIIMPGVTIGEGSVIGAGSVVTKDIPPYSVAIGSPAKVIRSFG